MNKLDQKRVRQNFTYAAAEFDRTDFFHAEIRSRVLERLQLVKITPQRILDLGTGTGHGAATLGDRFSDACVVGVDHAIGMLQQAQSRCGFLACADAGKLPLPAESFDLVFSNLAVHWFDEAAEVFAEVGRILRSPGLFTFTTLGPESFREIRSAWSDVDGYEHVHAFQTMHELGDALVRAGLREPVLDSEIVTVTYEDPQQLVRDLRAVGGTNSSTGRNPGLTGRRRWHAMLSGYGEFRDSKGRYPLTVEVVYGQAWAGTQTTGVSATGSEVRFPLSRLDRRSRC